MELPPGIIHIIAQTRLFTDGKTYAIVRTSPEMLRDVQAVLAQNQGPFYAQICDKDEITLVLPGEIWAPLRPLLSTASASAEYRLITFDVTLDLNLVGYLALLSRELAEAGISIFALSAFTHDHILVLEKDFERAWKTLWDFIRTCQSRDASDAE